MPKKTKGPANKKYVGCSMRGGNGAAEYGVATYGAAGQQHAGQGNLIVMKGGEQQQQQQQQQQGGETQKQGETVGGKTVVGNLVLPAALLYAREQFLRRSKKRVGKRSGKSGRKSRRNRRSRRRP
jgi:hypothetical protein